MLVLAPVAVCILSGIGVSQVLSTYMKNLDMSRLRQESKKQQDSTYPIKNEVRSNTQNRLGELYWCAVCARAMRCACRGAGICGDFLSEGVKWSTVPRGQN